MLCLTVLPDLLCLRPEGDVGLFQVEQSPRLGAKVGPVEAGQRHVIAVEAHWTTQLHGVLRQRHLEEGDVAAGDYLQHPGPVAVMGCIHICVTKTVGWGWCRRMIQFWPEHETCCWCYSLQSLKWMLLVLFVFNDLMSMFDCIQLLNRLVNCLKKRYTN